MNFSWQLETRESVAGLLALFSIFCVLYVPKVVFWSLVNPIGIGDQVRWLYTSTVTRGCHRDGAR
jgi:hypothetical protein